MRTTLTVDDQLLSELQELSRLSGRPFKVVVNDALREGLRALQSPAPHPYRLVSVAMGQCVSGVYLDKALALADSLEAKATVDKLELRR